MTRASSISGRSARLAVLAVSASLFAACSATSTNAADPAGSVGGSGTTVPTGSHAESGSTPGWPAYRHDLANTGFANDTKINAGNVAKLTQTWSTSGVTGVSGTPAVVDGVVYYGDWTGKMNAVGADSGNNIWATPLEGGWVI